MAYELSNINMRARYVYAARTIDPNYNEQKNPNDAYQAMATMLTTLGDGLGGVGGE